MSNPTYLITLDKDEIRMLMFMYKNNALQQRSYAHQMREECEPRVAALCDSQADLFEEKAANFELILKGAHPAQTETQSR